MNGLFRLATPLALLALFGLAFAPAAEAHGYNRGNCNSCYDPGYIAVPVAVPVGIGIPYAYFYSAAAYAGYQQPPYIDPNAAPAPAVNPPAPPPAAAPESPAAATSQCPPQNVTVNLDADRVADRIAEKLGPALAAAILKAQQQPQPVTPQPIPPPVVPPAPQPAPAPVPPPPARKVSVIMQNCNQCHSGASPKGGFTIASLALADKRHLAAAKIMDGTMPKGRALTIEQRTALLTELCTSP